MMSKKIHKIWLGVALIALVLAGGLGYLAYSYYNTEYSDIRIVEEYSEIASANSEFAYFSKDILRYSRDGVALYNKKGEELWNYPCQMQSPSVDICSGTAVIGDIGGTSIIVLTEEGVKGEFATARPIERLAVSAQGIVGAILKGETTPHVCCYDAKGTVLVEQKASLANTGYPLDLALSANGKQMIVTYFSVSGGAISTDVVFYSFENDTQEHEIARKTYKDTMIPSVSMLDGSKVVLAGDNKLIFWKNAKEPKEICTITIDGELKQCVTQNNMTAVVVKGKSSKGYELRVYEGDGSEAFSTSFTGEYSNIKVAGGKVILYEGERCLIYNMYGVKKYEGSIGADIKDLVPQGGWNRYLFLGADGMQKVQLTK